ncbi:hypothetical protein D3C80_353390 [compost metagenome]
MSSGLALARETYQHARSAIRGLRRQCLHGLEAGLEEGWLEHQVFRRIARNEKLRQHQQIGALAGSVTASLTGQGKIAGDIADRRIELGNSDTQGLGIGLGHDRDLMR